MMKISTLLTVAGISIASTLCVNAQTKESPWTFGVKAGVGVSTNKNVTDHFWGLDLGGTVDYQLNNRFYLSSGLEFAGKGITVTDKYTETITSPTGTSTEEHASLIDLTATFMQIPLTIGYKLPLSKNVNLTARGGMYAAYKIHDGSSSSLIKRNEVNNFDFGLLGGIGIEYKRFSLDANYEFGLTNLRRNNNNSYSNIYNPLDIRSDQNGDNISTITKINPSKWKNRNVSITVGYKF